VAVTVAVAVAVLDHIGQYSLHGSTPSTMQTGSSSWKEQRFRQAFGWVCQACVLHCPCAFGRLSETHAALFSRYTLKLGVLKSFVVGVRAAAGGSGCFCSCTACCTAGLVLWYHSQLLTEKLPVLFAAAQWSAGLVCGEGHGAEA
jgi:hypothetical protein